MKFPVLIISKEQTEDVQCRGGRQWSIIEERIVVWKVVKFPFPDKKY